MDETISDEFRPRLKAFMADLCWIENVGARGFAAMAKKAPDPTLAEIYRYFHAEEQRHANAELALMKRWGLLDDGELPEPNVNIRLASRPRDAGGGAGDFRQSAGGAGACTPGAVLGARGQRDGVGVGLPAHLACRPAREGLPAHPGERSLAAPSAHPRFQARLQADADLQRLLPRAAGRQLQAHRLADRRDQSGRGAHQ